MDQNHVAILALVVGAVGVIVAVVFGVVAFRQGRRRRPQLQLTNDFQEVTTGVQSSKLVVHWDGQPVRDPYLIRLSVRNSGGSDLTSGMYDQGRSIRAILSRSRFVAKLSDSPWQVVRLSEVDFAVEFGPDLIKQGQTTTVSLVVSGKPDVQWTHHFADVAVSALTEREILSSRYTRRMNPRFRDSFWFALLVVFLGGPAVALLLYLIAVGLASLA